jgi:hypothetical protein
VSQEGSASLKQIMDHLPDPTPRRTVQDNLQLLRALKLVAVRGKGIGARWSLTGPGP